MRPQHVWALALLLLPRCSSGFQFYMTYLPNGQNCKVNGRAWPAIGHTFPEAGLVANPARNKFAKDFAHAGYKWTSSLCMMDSDGDGLANGVELGDPNCTWYRGLADPPTMFMAGHPGVDESKVSWNELHASVRKQVRERVGRRAPLPKATNKAWSVWFDFTPFPSGIGEHFSWLNKNRLLYVFLHGVLPALVLLAVCMRDESSPIPLWGVLTSWLLLYAGIAIGLHRLFSHGACGRLRTSNPRPLLEPTDSIRSSNPFKLRGAEGRPFESRLSQTCRRGP